MAPHRQGLRTPRGHRTATMLVGKCPQCGRRVELKRMSVGLTVTKRFCGCMLKPREYKALVASAAQEG